jgi:hypothetical protein
MNKATHWIVLGICLFGLSWSLQAQDKVEIKKIDGITHIFNPAKPLKGIVQLEVEKTLTINPYDQPDVALKFFYFIRREDGAVILYDPNNAEAHRFGPKGEYLGQFFKKGQGPGEFSQGGIPFFLGDRIWAAEAMKLVEFDKDGKFLREQTLKDWLSVLVDETHYLSDRTEWNKDRTEQTKKLTLVRITRESLSDVREVDLIQGTNLGTISDKTGTRRFGDIWGTPRLIYAYANKTQNVFAAINSEYKIFVKNLKGETLSVIEKAHENAKVSRKDVESMLGPILKNDASKWILDAYPDHLVAMLGIEPLPNGYLLVSRISGPKESEIDVFDGEGRYIYALKPPQGQSFLRARFHAKGYGTTETKDEYQIYVDYRIKNLPEVFGK